MRRTNAEIQEQADADYAASFEAAPLLGDLSQIDGQGARVRCPVCGCLRASLLLVRHASRTDPMCRSCYKAGVRPASKTGTEYPPKTGANAAKDGPLASHRSQEPTHP